MGPALCRASASAGLRASPRRRLTYVGLMSGFRPRSRRRRDVCSPEARRGIVRGLQQRGRENAAQEGGGEKGDGCQGKGKSAGAMPSLARVLDPPTLRTPFAALTVLGSLP